MRATNLITISTIALLMGGTSLALGQRGGTASSGLSERGEVMGSVRGQDIKGARGSATTAERRRAMSGERGGAMTAERGRVITSERGGAMTAERGRAIKGERGTALTAERGRVISGERGTAMTAEHGRVIRGERGAALTAERGRAMEATGLSEQQRMRLHDILSARGDIPRAPRVAAGAIRVDALVPRGVRLAAVPGDIARIYPRLRRDRVFIQGDRIVFVDPVTSRIVAVVRG